MRRIRFNGPGPFVAALNEMAAGLFAARNITAAAPLVVNRTEQGTHLALLGGRALAEGVVRVVSDSAGGAESDWDALTYAIEFVGEQQTFPEVGTNPVDEVHRVLPGIARFGSGRRVLPARPGTAGVVRTVRLVLAGQEVTRRQVILFDEIVAGASC